MSHDGENSVFSNPAQVRYSSILLTSSMQYAISSNSGPQSQCPRTVAMFTSRSAIGLPPNYRRVGSRIALFEACSAYTRVPACTVAELLNAALCHRSASDHVVTSMTRFGCYQPKATIVGRDLHPLGKRACSRRTEISGQDLSGFRKRIAPVRLVHLYNAGIGLFEFMCSSGESFALRHHVSRSGRKILSPCQSGSTIRNFF